MPDVRANPARANRPFRVGLVVPLVEAEVCGAPRPTGSLEDDSIEDVRHHPVVVNVGRRRHDGEGNTAPARQEVALHSQFRPVRRVGPRAAPPFGAFTSTGSREVHVHWIPRGLG